MSTPALQLTLDPGRLDLAAGQSGSVTMKVRNVGRTVQHLVVRVEGLPDGATYTPTPDGVKLLPGTEATIAVEVRLPETPLAAAGVHVLGLVCYSNHDSSVSRCEELSLTVEPAPALTMTFDRQLVRSLGQGRFIGMVTNTGNTTLATGFRATDPEGRVRVQFNPRAVTLAPRQRAHVVLTASAPAVWTGQERQQPIKVDAEAELATAQATVTLVQRPRLPPGVLRLVGGTAGLLVLAGAIVGGLWIAGNNKEPPPDSDATAPTDSPTTEPTSESPTESLTPTDSPTSETPTDTTTPTVPALQSETFDGVTPGPARGVFEGFRASTRPEVDCLGGANLVAEEQEEDIVLTADKTEDVCQPLMVLFDDPAQDVVLRVSGDDLDYSLRLEDWDGDTRPRKAQSSKGEVVVPSGGPSGLRSVILTLDDVDAGPEDLVGLSEVTWRNLAE